MRPQSRQRLLEAVCAILAYAVVLAAAFLM